jgi:hypothetical protein
MWGPTRSRDVHRDALMQVLGDKAGWPCLLD